jgi:hypothetical protein
MCYNILVNKKQTFTRRKNMSANIHGKMVYSFEKPMWHNITEPSLIPMTAEGILDNRFGGGFPIYLRPITLELNGEPTETGDFGIVRGKSPYDQKEGVFGYCSDRYLPLQPRDVCKSYDVNVKEYAETMAFLGKGEEMFISWKMPSCEVRTGDEVEMFGIVRTGFDTLKGARLFTSIVRPVCWNTITFAQAWAKQNTDGQGKGNIWKGKGVNKNLLRDLGYWMAHVQEHSRAENEILRNFFVKLAKTPVKNDVEAHEILFEAYPPVQDVSEYYPAQLRTAKEEKTVDENLAVGEIRDGIYRLFAGDGTAITPDYWGMLNATSEYFCHVQASKRPIAESVMFGGRQKNSMKMVTTLSNRVR